MKSILLIFQIVVTPTVFGFTPGGERPLIFTGGNIEKTIFCMMPGKYEYSKNRKYSIEPIGVAYKLKNDGSLKELYRTQGWYADTLYVSNSGKYLVRIGSDNRGSRALSAHVAVAFYKNGQLIKSYSTAELVKDHNKIERITNVYFWRGEISKLEGNEYTIQTIDNWIYTFNILSGKMISQKKLSGKGSGMNGTDLSE